MPSRTRKGRQLTVFYVSTGTPVAPKSQLLTAGAIAPNLDGLSHEIAHIFLSDSFELIAVPRLRYMRGFYRFVFYIVKSGQHRPRRTQKTIAFPRLNFIFTRHFS